LDTLFDVHRDIFERKMYMHSFDLWVSVFLLLVVSEASDVFGEAELAVEFVEDDS
jgi:hypothetical protein